MQHNTPPTATTPSTPASPATHSTASTTPTQSNPTPPPPTAARPSTTAAPPSFYHTRKSSIASLLSPSPPPLPPDLSAQLAAESARGRVTVRQWVQGDVVALDPAAFPDWADVDDGTSPGRPLRVVLRRLPAYQTAALDVGSYVMCVGVVRERRTEAGVAMLAHVCKVMTEAQAVRRSLWQFELDDMQRVDSSRQRQWTEQQQQQSAPGTIR